MLATLQALYLFGPLLLASALSAIVLKYDLLRSLRRPIDHGWKVRGRRIFGDSKTWRGVVVAVVGCVAGVAIQRAVAGDHLASISLVDYRALDFVPFGISMGIGAMLGELPNSFIKRQLGIAPGKTTTGPLRGVFYLWDQVDLIAGAWLTISPWVRPSPGVVVASFVLAAVIHPTVSLVGYLIGARSSAR
ncbi:MAG: putative CDP-diglyceride synthetase [Deltaproteobacteria bacterium]|nr:putative CDP-diglyceride synthetase [Deltaproteobacteria bacterium]